MNTYSLFYALTSVILSISVFAESASNCRRQVLMLDGNCEETVESCRSENGGKPDCRELCKTSTRTFEIPAIFDTCNADRCREELAACLEEVCPFRAVNVCEEPHPEPVEIIRNSLCTPTINFQGLEECKGVLKCDEGVDLRTCADGLLDKHPGCAYTLEDHCVDTVSFKQDKASSSCKTVKKPVCREDVVSHCRRKFPQCFNRKCGVKTLTEHVEIEDCFQNCTSGIRCENVPAPQCYNAVFETCDRLGRMARRTKRSPRFGSSSWSRTNLVKVYGFHNTVRRGNSVFLDDEGELSHFGKVLLIILGSLFGLGLFVWLIIFMCFMCEVCRSEVEE